MDTEARRQHWRTYYERHTDKVKANNSSQKQRLRDEVNAIKSQPCADCGRTYPPYVMDFDHRDPSTKEAVVAVLVMNGARKKALAEIEKCDVVCSNCHRIRTHG